MLIKTFGPRKEKSQTRDVRFSIKLGQEGYEVVILFINFDLWTPHQSDSGIGKEYVWPSQWSIPSCLDDYLKETSPADVGILIGSDQY